MLLLLLFIMHRIAGAASRAHIYLSSASIERNSMGKKRFDLILDARDISFFFLLPSRRSSPRVTFVFGIRFVLIFIFESFLYIIFSCSIRNHISSIVLYQFIGTADIVIYLPIYYSCVEGLVFFFSVRRWQMEASQDIEYIFFVWNNISVSEMFTPGMHSNEMRELLGNKRKCFKYI